MTFLHGAVIVYNRPWQAFLRKRFWVVCHFCDIRRGPFRTENEARVALKDTLAARDCPPRRKGAK